MTLERSPFLYLSFLCFLSFIFFNVRNDGFSKDRMKSALKFIKGAKSLLSTHADTVMRVELSYPFLTGSHRFSFEELVREKRMEWFVAAHDAFLMSWRCQPQASKMRSQV